MSLPKWLRWEEGRQKNGYRKMFLLGCPVGFLFDCYLIHFPEGCEVKPHADPVPNKRHYRLNVYFKQPQKGGMFVCAEQIYSNKVVSVFRSDTSEHSLTKVESGSGYMLSIGWAI